MPAAVTVAWTGWEIGLAIAASLSSIAVSMVVTGFVIVRLPPDYFVREHRPLPLEGHRRWVRIAARVGMNLGGLILIALGVVMSLPGVPGQGILTILLGVMLVDLPYKRRLEGALVRRELLHKGINKLRARYGRPPIEIPVHPALAAKSAPRDEG